MTLSEVYNKWKTVQSDPWRNAAPVFKTITAPGTIGQPGKDYKAVKAEALAKIIAQNKIRGNAYKAHIFKKLVVAPIQAEVPTEDFNYYSEICEVNDESQ